jgi:energy-coupling factor transporter ATP-binding protein EcfA2
MSATLDAVLIESIEIAHAPGLPNGLKIDTFGPGINIVAGPNASGKSTTARLLHQLFSHTIGNEDIEATIRFSYQGASWRVRRYGQHLSTFKNDVLTPLPRFEAMSDETRSRYLLSLHDLLRADDMAFARAVLQEAAGGFDLERAAKSVQYDLPKTESTLTREWEAARRAIDAARRRQETLAQDEARLGQLREQELTAISAQSALEELRLIEAALEAAAELTAADARLVELPADLARYRGDEIEQIEALRIRELDLLERHRLLDALIVRERAALEATGIVPGPATREAIQQLQGIMVALDRHQAETERAQIALEVAVERERSSRNGISSALRLDQPDESARALLVQLSETVERRDDAARQLRTMQQLQAWVGEIPEQRDLRDVQESLHLLREWLRAPETAPLDPNAARLRVLAIAAAVLIVVEAVILGVAVHPGFFALAIAGLGAGAGALLARSEPTVDLRRQIVTRAERLGLLASDEWNETDVLAALNDLTLEEQAEIYDRARAARWSGLRADAERVERERLEADVAATEIQQQLGLAQDLSRPVLGQLAESIRIWLLNVDAVTAASAEFRATSDRRDRVLASLNTLAADFGVQESDDCPGAKARLTALQQRADEANRSAAEIAAAEHERDVAILPGLAAVERERAAMLARLNAESLEAVEAIAPLREHWAECKRVRDELETTFRDRTRNLVDIDLASWPQERIFQERAELERAAAKQQEVSQQIGAIERGVADARAGTSIDSALRGEENAIAALRERFAQRARQIVADRIADHVRRESELSSLSPVARIARRRFADFTRGRYLLHFRTSGGAARFVAEDRHADSKELQLDQLSSATRVQLLIAVRAAFVEMNEREAVLPLFLDETLANSDDVRADAMVAATNDLSARGRQIFYFTAQQDEVARWQDWHRDHPEIPLQVALLDGELTHRQREQTVELPRIGRAAPPAPNGHSRLEYRQVIGAGRLDLWASTDHDIHLWYLVPELDRLHRLIYRRVDTWGQLRTFIDSGAFHAFDLSPLERDAIRARAKTCHAIRGYMRIGRAKPVTALVLESTGAITPAFREQVQALLIECNGEGATLVDHLRGGKISGFRRSNTDAIEEYFRSFAHIVDSSPMAPDHLRHAVMIDADDSLRSGAITMNDIDRLFSDLEVGEPAKTLVMQGIGE